MPNVTAHQCKNLTGYHDHDHVSLVPRLIYWRAPTASFSVFHFCVEKKSDGLVLCVCGRAEKRCVRAAEIRGSETISTTRCLYERKQSTRRRRLSSVKSRQHRW